MSEYDQNPGGATPPPYDTAPAAGAVSQDDRTMALLTHLSGIVLGFVVPLIMWLVHKDRSDKAFVVDQAKEALNFNITLMIAYIGVFILTIVTLGLASPLGFLLWVASIVFFVIAGIKANSGEAYRYPLSWRLVK
ncbi:DUF4870 domain-containing protein [Cognatilysobacter terrigena]|uniref:DUF4870 domain-containing protein n=1 Tax=Cognatilysobacter terrigena TaxID=2488749 RepID=UPI00105F9CC8|nr:DUF4870 domain-containing protein [Lysobacter terrigena]